MKTGTYLVICMLMLLLSVHHNVNGQGIGINILSPDASSMLEIASTSKGLLTPRMTTAQRVAIAAPANGLLVYDISLNSFYFFDGVIWKPIASGSTAWSLTGNSGTDPATNFLGTIDNQPLLFKVNNLLSGYIDNKDGAFLGRNTFFGKEAGLNYSVNGYENTFIGFKSGTAIVSGDLNMAAGSHSLQNVTTGFANVAIGSRAMKNTTTGFQNC